jgi:hypothetical protein
MCPVGAGNLNALLIVILFFFIFFYPFSISSIWRDDLDTICLPYIGIYMVAKFEAAYSNIIESPRKIRFGVNYNRVNRKKIKIICIRTDKNENHAFLYNGHIVVFSIGIAI